MNKLNPMLQTSDLKYDDFPLMVQEHLNSQCIPMNLLFDYTDPYDPLYFHPYSPLIVIRVPWSTRRRSLRSTVSRRCRCAVVSSTCCRRRGPSSRRRSRICAPSTLPTTTRSGSAGRGCGRRVGSGCRCVQSTRSRRSKTTARCRGIVSSRGG